MADQWNKILELVSKTVSPVDFKVWIRPVSVQVAGRRVHLALVGASAYMVRRLKEKFSWAFCEAAAAVLSCRPEQIELTCSDAPLDLSGPSNRKEHPTLPAARRQTQENSHPSEAPAARPASLALPAGPALNPAPSCSGGTAPCAASSSRTESRRPAPVQLPLFGGEAGSQRPFPEGRAPRRDMKPRAGKENCKAKDPEPCPASCGLFSPAQSLGDASAPSGAGASGPSCAPKAKSAVLAKTPPKGGRSLVASKIDGADACPLLVALTVGQNPSASKKQEGQLLALPLAVQAPLRRQGKQGLRCASAELGRAFGLRRSSKIGRELGRMFALSGAFEKKPRRFAGSSRLQGRDAFAGEIRPARKQEGLAAPFLPFDVADPFVFAGDEAEEVPTCRRNDPSRGAWGKRSSRTPLSGLAFAKSALSGFEGSEDAGVPVFAGAEGEDPSLYRASGSKSKGGEKLAGGDALSCLREDAATVSFSFAGSEGEEPFGCKGVSLGRGMGSLDPELSAAARSLDESEPLLFAGDEGEACFPDGQIKPRLQKELEGGEGSSASLETSCPDSLDAEEPDCLEFAGDEGEACFPAGQIKPLLRKELEGGGGSAASLETSCPDSLDAEEPACLEFAGGEGEIFPYGCGASGFAHACAGGGLKPDRCPGLSLQSEGDLASPSPCGGEPLLFAGDKGGSLGFRSQEDEAPVGEAAKGGLGRKGFLESVARKIAGFPVSALASGQMSGGLASLFSGDVAESLAHRGKRAEAAQKGAGALDGAGSLLRRENPSSGAGRLQGEEPARTGAPKPASVCAGAPTPAPDCPKVPEIVSGPFPGHIDVVAEAAPSLRSASAGSARPAPVQELPRPGLVTASRPDLLVVSEELREPPVQKKLVAGGLLPPAPLERPVSLSGGRLAKKIGRYSFDDFVVGPSNELAAAAAKEVCSESGDVETLFLSSGTGLGKTHIAQAVADAVSQTKQGMAKVAYLTAEDFFVRFRDGLRYNNLGDFSEQVKALDFFLLDDVPFLYGKTKTQEFLHSVVKQLQSNGSKVVFTSSLKPKELNALDSQLVSLICSGILASMESPTYEMRCEILRRKAQESQVVLPDDVMHLLASNLTGDIRQLESCLQTLLLKVRLLKAQLTTKLAMDVLSQFTASNDGDGEDSPRFTFEEILRYVTSTFGTTEAELGGNVRRRDLVAARNTLFYLARMHTDMTFTEIGRRLHKCHTTVIKGITAIKHEIESGTVQGREVQRVIDAIERRAGFC